MQYEWTAEIFISAWGISTAGSFSLTPLLLICSFKRVWSLKEIRNKRTIQQYKRHLKFEDWELKCNKNSGRKVGTPFLYSVDPRFYSRCKVRPSWLSLMILSAHPWKLATTVSFHVISTSLFTVIPPIRVRVPAGAGNFSLCHCVQTGSGFHTTSYPMGTEGSFLECKAAGA